MEGLLLTSLTWILALCAGLMAGTYLAFSGFIMRAFATLGTADAIAAMNSVNTVILKSSFMPLFFGSTIVALLLAITSLWQWGAAGTDRALAAGVIYFVGMFVVTATANVPLNNALAKVSGAGEHATQTWTHYRNRWTSWNTVRTVASLVTLVICIDTLSG